MNRCILWTLLFATGLPIAIAVDEAPQQLFAEPKKDWVWDQDKRFDFLMERLASLEASLDAIDASIAKTTGRKSARQSEARRQEDNNSLMDRKGGGPMAWREFYGTNAEKFFYHPVDPSTSYWTVTSLRQMGSSQDDKVGAGVPASQSLPVHQRPPQWDYIYRANRDARDRAEEEARKLEGKLEELNERRFQLEQEQAELWARLAFRVIERLNIPRKPVLRFQLVGASAEPVDAQRAQALQAAAQFLSTALLVIDKAEKDQATALSSVRGVVSKARESLDDALLEADAVAEDVTNKETSLGKYVALAQLLDDTSNNLGESYDVAMEGDRAKDDARKDRFRGLLQRSLVEYAEILLALDELTGVMKDDWKVVVDTKTKLPVVEVAWSGSASGESSPSESPTRAPKGVAKPKPQRAVKPKPVIYRFVKEAEIRESWDFMGDGWRIENGLLKMQRGTSIVSKQQYQGDLMVAVRFQGRIEFRCFGGSFVADQSPAAFERQGGTLIMRLPGRQPTMIELREAQQGVASPVSIGRIPVGVGGEEAVLGEVQIVGTQANDAP